jgi:hypothetical protein
LFDPGDIQEDSDPLAGIEEQEDNATLIPLWLQLLEVEAADLLDDSE